MSFVMSLGRTLYFALKPQKGGGSKHKVAIFNKKILTLICDNFKTVRDWM